VPTKSRILVAEDDAGVRDLIRTRLDTAGYEVQTAHNGVEALDWIRGVHFDAVILDINMPEMDGFEVLAAMGSVSSVRIPVLVLTARHAAADVQRAISLGAKDYLAKPFNEVQLQARVARLLRPSLSAPTAVQLV
jgi:DNA-binding response OmpR family regulator